MKRLILKSIFLISEIVLMILVAFAFYFASTIQTPKQLRIEKGSIAKIVTDLNTKEDVAVWIPDRYLLNLLGSPQSGWIDIGSETLTRADFLHRLTTAKAPLFAIRLIPGETTYHILRMLATKLHYPLDMLQKEYDRLAPYSEGVLFADTYYLPKGIDAKALIRYLVKSGLDRHRRLSYKLFGNYNQKLWFERVVTIASIIQKEAANTKEMPLISAVIYNRLRKGMPLQMDGALNYGKYSHVKVTPKRIREDKSPFNTYLHKGLPPYPVCIVSLPAIKAAIAPAKVDYLYFVRGVDGYHVFSKNYSQHLRHIKDVKKRNRKRKSRSAKESLSKVKRE